MVFPCDGLSWAGTIYQKFENMTTNSDMLQIPSRCADAVTEHIKKVLDEFTDDLLDPAGGRVKATVSDMPIDGDFAIENCKKSAEALDISVDEKLSMDENAREGLDKILLDEKLQTCVKVDSAASVEDPSLVETSNETENIVHDINLKYASNKQSKKLLPTEPTSPTCLHGTEENCDIVLDPATSLAKLACRKSKELDDIFSDEKLLSSVKEELVVSSAEDKSMVASSDEAQYVARDLADVSLWNENKEGPIPTEAIGTSCLDNMDGNCKNISNPVKYLADVTSDPLSADGALPFLSNQNKAFEGTLISSGNSSPTGTYTSQDMASHLGSLGNKYERQIELNRSEAFFSLSGSDVSEIHHKEDMLKSTDIVDPKTELMEEFEDVDLHDSWDDDEDYELASVPYQERKNRSYKKKLKAVLLSKLRLSKNHEREEIWYQNINIIMQERQGIASSSVSDISTFHDSVESDWEFL